MSDDAPHHLDSLTVGRLKAVAKRYSIDVSTCKHKKDLVAQLATAGITEAQVSDALAANGSAAEETRDVAEIRLDIETIAGKSSKSVDLPAAESKDVEANIDRVLLARPSFFELDSMVETAWNQMIMADYHGALEVNSEARSKMLDRFSSFQIFSCALSIRAAESIISNLSDGQGKVDPSLATALVEAKRAFVDGNPRHREQTLAQLEALTSKAYEAFFVGSTRAEAELRTLLSDYESFGTQTTDSRRLLEIAEQARQSYNVAEYARILDDATGAASRAKEARTKEIEQSLGLARSAVHEAREVGAVLAVGDDELRTAKEALDTQAFRRAIDLIASVEMAADKAHLERIRDQGVRQKQTVRVTETIAGLEKTLQEAASYGMDVQEGLLFVSKAKGALVERDLVRAAKLTRHLKDRSEDMSAQLDNERVERGVAVKIEDAKCGKCGKVSLYSFPGELRKCVKCGHSFSMAPERPQPTMEHIEKPVSTADENSPRPDVQPSETVKTRRLLSR